MIRLLLVSMPKAMMLARTAVEKPTYPKFMSGKNMARKMLTKTLVMTAVEIT